MQIEKLVNDIEQELYSLDEQEVKSDKIGELAMNHLSQINEVAYVRFASVYRHFKDISSFEKELSIIRQMQEVKR